MSLRDLLGTAIQTLVRKTSFPLSGSRRVLVVKKCANPSCSARFKRLREGRLFVVEVSPAKEPQKLKYFWLCNSCRRTLTVIPGKEDEVTIAPLASANAQ
jgi:hypothetical protein